MKRLVLALAVLALAAPLVAEKTRRVPRQAGAGAPVTVTITSTPLTIVVGDDTSLQVYNSNVPGAGQFYPPDCGPGETADYGVFAAVGGVVYGPDFDNHPCGSASNTYTPWTLVSMSPVTGTGAAGNPFTVVIVVNAGATGLQLTETLTYLTGAPRVDIALSFSELAPPSGPQGGITFDVFAGADLYLADNDDGFGLLQGTSAGGRAADASCLSLQYVILLEGNTASNRHVADDYSTVWDEISAANLSNTVDPSCQDNGAALQWTGLVVSGSTTANVSTGVSFTGTATPEGGATVPTLSTAGLAALILLLAVVGYVLVRKTSLGA
jgi:exosortase sorting signal-containing protein